METKTKILIGILIALLIALPLVVNTFAIPAYNDTTNSAPALDPTTPSSEQNETLKPADLGQIRQELGETVRFFFKDAEDVTIDAKVVTYTKRILVVDSEGKRLNILLPQRWSVNEQDKVYNVSGIFEEGFIEAGDTVTINALQREFTNQNDVTVSFIAACEIIDGSNNLQAVLPFNIKP